MGSVCSHSAHLFHLLIRPDQARRNLSLPYPRERKPLRPSVGTMQLPRMTALLLLLSNGLCSSEDSPGALNTSTTQSPGVPTTNESVTTPGIMPVTNLETKITTGIPPEGTTNNEPTKMSTTSSIFPLTVSKSEETTTLAVTKNELFTMEPTVTNHSLSNATSVLASSIKTENQNSIKTTAMSVNIQPKGTSPEAAVLPSRTVTTPKNISPFQDTEDGKNTTTPPIIPSYSSIILPVVIALIVITLLVFTLVGLYRMCWKRDPGMPENGNDQPQSDKESVKLLTVKAISHESGEHSAQGKAKN